MNTQVKITYKMKELNLYRIWQILNKVSEAGSITKWYESGVGRLI